MRHPARGSVFFGLFLLVAVLPAFALPGPSDSPARIEVARASGTIRPVTPWDPSSPQKLVTIEGRLYQKDAGWYYRAVDDRIWRERRSIASGLRPC